MSERAGPEAPLRPLHLTLLLSLLLLLLLRGSAAANAISQYIQAVVLFIYICVMGLHKSTWPGGRGIAGVKGRLALMLSSLGSCEG